jgi:hypothetical protein
VGDIAVKGVVGECGFECASQVGVALAVGRDSIIAGSELAGDVGVDGHVVEIALAAVDKEGVGVGPGEDEVRAAGSSRTKDGADLVIRLDEELEGAAEEVNRVADER